MGLNVEEYSAQVGAPLTPQTAGGAVVEVLTDPARAAQAAFLLTATGLRPMDERRDKGAT